MLSLSATPLDCEQLSQTQDVCFDKLTLIVIFRLALWSFKECQVARVDIFLKNVDIIRTCHQYFVWIICRIL